jgi:ADP-ribose pyrophosphatase YjhB (NUDIX family)
MSYFSYCPICGSNQLAPRGENLLVCGACNFHYHHNPVVAVAALLADGSGRLLLLRRAADPGKGKLGVPGGFVDIGETAETALRREIKEEVNLDVSSLEYFGSYPNEYLYRGRIIPVLDLYFEVRVRSWSEATALDEVEGLVFLHPKEIDPTTLAFRSLQVALRDYNPASS